MDGWKYYNGRKVFIILKNNRKYSGKVIEVDDSISNIIWISIIDKFDNRIKFSVSEIDLIEEERE